MNEIDFSVLRLPFEKGKWRDADERMFHACFLILGQYVEEELGTESWFDIPLYRGYREHSADGSDSKAIDLWLWYKEELPAMIQDRNEDMKQCYIADETQLLGIRRVKKPKYDYSYIDNLKNRKLRKLIKIRRTLWT